MKSAKREQDTTDKDQLLLYQMEKVERLEKEAIQSKADKAEMQGIIDKRNEELRERDERYDEKCRECEVLKCELAHQKSINQLHDDYRQSWENKMSHLTFDARGLYTIEEVDSCAVNSNTALQMEKPTSAINTAATATPAPISRSAPKVTFAERVKSIIRTAASLNGQTIMTKAKGHASSYTYYINDDCFCKAMDVLVKENADELREFLGGKLDSKLVSQVCLFIGHVIRMCIINDDHLQIKDIVFAFKDYYDSPDTVQSRLSIKSCSHQDMLLFRKFAVLLNRMSA